MPKIDSYENDSNIESGDKVLGTDITGTTTKNYQVSDLTSYFEQTLKLTSTYLTVKAGENLAKGDCVNITAYDSGYSASKTNNTTSIVDGIVLADIASGETGSIILSGVLSGIDTSFFSIGDILYCNSTGVLVDSKPSSGNIQPVGTVIRSDGSLGVIIVSVGNAEQKASDVKFTPAGDLIATNTQGAIEELDTKKEPSFNKNAGFNKNFGTTSGTVSEGDHIHTSLSTAPTEPVISTISDNDTVTVLEVDATSTYNITSITVDAVADGKLLIFLVINTGDLDFSSAGGTIQAKTSSVSRGAGGEYSSITFVKAGESWREISVTQY